MDVLSEHHYLILKALAAMAATIWTAVLVCFYIVYRDTCKEHRNATKWEVFKALFLTGNAL